MPIIIQKQGIHLKEQRQILRKQLKTGERCCFLGEICDPFFITGQMRQDVLQWAAFSPEKVGQRDDCFPRLKEIGAGASRVKSLFTRELPESFLITIMATSEITISLVLLFITLVYAGHNALLMLCFRRIGIPCMLCRRTGRWHGLSPGPYSAAEMYAV